MYRWRYSKLTESLTILVGVIVYRAFGASVVYAGAEIAGRAGLAIAFIAYELASLGAYVKFEEGRYD